jgi:hypothetical protein
VCIPVSLIWSILLLEGQWAFGLGQPNSGWNGTCASTSGAKSTLTQPPTMSRCVIDRVAAGDSVNRLASTNFRICGRLTASPEETKRNVDIVMPLVNDILTYVHQRDERFKIQPLRVGSYYSHLKVSRADEFDYSVVLATPSLVWTSGTPAYYGFDENKQQVVRTSVSLPSPPVGKCLVQVGGIIEKWDQQRLNEGQSCLTVGDHLIPIKVKRRFKQLVGEAVNRPQIRKFVDARRLTELTGRVANRSHKDGFHTPKKECFSNDKK